MKIRAKINDVNGYDREERKSTVKNKTYKETKMENKTE